MVRALPVVALLLLLLLLPGLARGDELVRETAEGHPMQYWVAPPRKAEPGRSYPVVVVVEAAEKQFAENARRFVAARGDRPFILVAPIIVTNGRQGQRDPAIYPYTAATWERIDRDGVCAFDLDGLARVLDDVRRKRHGDGRVLITGFEAGAHLVWAFALLHPERLRAAAPVAGNYIGRCVDEAAISRDPARATLPIRGFAGAADEMFGPAGKLHGQFETARALAVAHGFAAVDEVVVPGTAHVPMPDEVLAWFAEVTTGPPAVAPAGRR
jgi:poly(3-hydroxybutyrate) depolymerase